ncbi:recombinase family protein [Brumicola pallidula]|uniref:Protein uvp1 n=1 Tax=Brumicola pallidula DSM 14239 = ACAM 615 TaxID=1121922 RepID=K6ZZ97_9ALTE|nr:recombinase family protein [Glaciecola pallidula]GAC28610.1 protein uvp1 [Glaciecola pallidula DSM 14239 = ACAM 615]
MALIGFARVSTENQELTNQLEQLTGAGCERIFHGKQSGISKENVLQLQALVDYARDGDAVVVTKLDRLGRSLKSILETIQRLADKKVTFKTLDGSIDTTNSSPFATAQLSLIGVFAQLERDLIVQRTGEGRKSAIARGVKFGRKPSLTHEQQKEVKAKIKRRESVYAIAKQYEVSRQTIMRIRDK